MSGRFHSALAHLRANAPVSWVEVPGYRPFWAVTKHADIMDIERANTLFTNSPRPVLVTAEGDDLQAGIGVSTLIHMDDPQHRDVRAIGANWFRPKAMRAMKVRIDELAKAYVDKMVEKGAGVRLRPGGRRQLPAVRDPFAARHAGVRLPDDASAHAGTVRKRRRRVQARYVCRRPDARAAGDVPVLHGADRFAAGEPDGGPGIGDRQRRDRRRAAFGHRRGVLLPDHRRRGTRHHERDDLRRHAGIDRKPRPACSIGRRPRR